MARRDATAIISSAVRHPRQAGSCGTCSNPSSAERHFPSLAVTAFFKKHFVHSSDLCRGGLNLVDCGGVAAALSEVIPDMKTRSNATAGELDRDIPYRLDLRTQLAYLASEWRKMFRAETMLADCLAGA